MDISTIDFNFKLQTLPDNLNIEYYNIEENPFNIFGVMKEKGQFRRLPLKVAKSVSEGMVILSSCTSGGRVTFETNSRYIVLVAKMPRLCKMSHFSTIGSAGFDLYVENEYRGSFNPEYNFENGYSGVIDLKDNNFKKITVNFPLYSEASQVLIGIENGAELKGYNPYKNISPIVYYGSSITQGGCASRPGNTYPAEISRRTGINFINLGFSGGAKGEKEIAEYVKTLDMSVFVMDYDHNAPTVEDLKATHKPFFDIIRNEHKNIPVIFVTRPDFYESKDDVLRRAVVFETYIEAVKSGDTNVYFIDGSRIFGNISRSFCTADGVHPNDLGFYMMAEHIGKMIEKVLKEK